MKVLDSSLKNHILKIINLEQGPVYIFDQFIITEFNEGITVDEDCFLRLYQIVDNLGSEKEYFGFISNRTNSYAIDAQAFKKALPYTNRFYTSAFVTYTKRMYMTTSFEQCIYDTEFPTFSNLESAVEWMKLKFSKPRDQSQAK